MIQSFPAQSTKIIHHTVYSRQTRSPSSLNPTHLQCQTKPERVIFDSGTAAESDRTQTHHSAGLSWMWKCAELCGLTVCVPVVPQALHLPVRQDLEMVPAVHTVQLRQPPVVSKEIAVHCLELEYSRAFIRHHALQPRIQQGFRTSPRGSKRAVSPCSGQVSTCSYPSTEMEWMRVPDSCCQ